MTTLPISLPVGFTPLVQKGDTVTIGQKIAKQSVHDEETINLADAFDISPEQAKKTLQKVPGEAVRVGDILATKKGLFGWNKDDIISKVDGTVARYERDTGNLVIHTSYHSLTENLISPVDGIISLCNNEEIVIATDKNVISGKKASGRAGEGEVFILQESFSDDTRDLLFILDSRAIGKVVVGGRLTKDVLLKGIGIGAKGIIATDMAETDIAYISQKRMPTPVVEVDIDAVKKLLQWDGKKVYIDPDSKSIIFLHSE